MTKKQENKKKLKANHIAADNKKEEHQNLKADHATTNIKKVAEKKVERKLK